MRPTAYVHERTHTDTSRIHITPNLIVVDVGLFQSVALLHLPITGAPQKTEAEWIGSELARLSEGDNFQRAMDAGLVEFRVADRNSGSRHTKDDVINQLKLAVSVPGGISKFARAHVQSRALRAS